jgi:hypothetical protein
MSDPLLDNEQALKQALVDLALGRPFTPDVVVDGIAMKGEPEVPKANVRLEALKFALTYTQEPDDSPLGQVSLDTLQARAAEIRQRQALAASFKVSDRTPDPEERSGRTEGPDPEYEPSGR